MLLRNALDGDDDEINARATKNIYLSSRPMARRRAYATSAGDICDDSLADVAQYMGTLHGFECVDASRRKRGCQYDQNHQ